MTFCGNNGKAGLFDKLGHFCLISGKILAGACRVNNIHFVQNLKGANIDSISNISETAPSDQPVQNNILNTDTRVT